MDKYVTIALARPPRRWVVAAAFAGVLSAAGCETWQPSTLDEQAFAAEWRARGTEKPDRRGPPDAATNHDDVFDLEDGLTLTEAETAAMVCNPELRRQRAAAGVALAGAAEAGIWTDPAFGITLERILESVEQPWVLAGSLSFTIPVSGRLTAERSLADASAERALLEVAAAEWRERMNVRRDWAAWVAAAHRESLLDAYALQLEALIAIARRLESSGIMRRTDLRLFLAEAALRRAERAQVAAATEAARRRILARMGLRPDAPTQPSQRTWPALGDVPERLDDAEATLLACDVVLAITRSEFERADQALRLEISKQWPDLQLGPGYGDDEGQPRALLGIDLPIPVWNGNRRGIAEARAALTAARAGYEEAHERRIAQLHAAMARLRATQAASRVLVDELAPLLDEQIADLERQAALGSLDPLVLLDSLSRRHQGQVEMIGAELALAEATIDVTEILGPAREAAADVDPEGGSK